MEVPITTDDYRVLEQNLSQRIEMLTPPETASESMMLDMLREDLKRIKRIIAKKVGRQ